MQKVIEVGDQVEISLQGKVTGIELDGIQVRYKVECRYDNGDYCGMCYIPITGIVRDLTMEEQDQEREDHLRMKSQ